MDSASRDGSVQASLFEEDYLLRSLGGIGANPDVALTELVANAWDAGAHEVRISIPDQLGDELTVEDDGSGLTDEQFRQRWMTLGYNRLKHQGSIVEFPNETSEKRRRAYGRNGVGRHGLLCFNDRYTVETSRSNHCATFIVAATSGNAPFVLLRNDVIASQGHGTKLTVKVERNLPSPERVREILSARFLHDPQFTVYVNGKALELSELRGLVYQSAFTVLGKIHATLIVVDSAQSAKTSRHHGIAIWVGGRLVGEPSWSIGENLLLDRRTSIAKRHTIVIQTDDLFDDVTPDWSAFRDTPEVREFRRVATQEVRNALRTVAAARVDETTELVIREHAYALRKLTPLGQHEVAELVEEITHEQPTISSESLSLAVKAAIRLEQTRGGRELLSKLILVSDEDLEGINRLLNEWSIKDALTVLDEIEQRLAVVEALDRLSRDAGTDELSTLHPLVAKARWLFGPEYDSPLFASNTTLRRALISLWNVTEENQALVNGRRRPDLIVLPDRSTVSAVGIEEIDSESGLAKMDRILLIELKRGGFRVGRKEMTQANDYVEELLSSGALDTQANINAFVVGETIDENLQELRIVGDPERARIRLVTYGRLVRTAEQRLFRLKSRLVEHYDKIEIPALMARAFGVQNDFFLDSAPQSNPWKEAAD